jgi:hypothetical protein
VPDKVLFDSPTHEILDRCVRQLLAACRRLHSCIRPR